jgi:hypothetical protein
MAFADTYIGCFAVWGLLKEKGATTWRVIAPFLQG